MRVGFGYDVHRLKHGRKCVLCGVEIPCDFGPDGHSDADVAIHAFMDAMIGALALGDIGKHFPDTDEKWKDADSIELMKDVYRMVSEKGYSIGNADITIVLESPRLSPFIDLMRTAIASALDIDSDRISVKATTEEKLGFIGDGTGIAAMAVVLLEKT